MSGRAIGRRTLLAGGAAGAGTVVSALPRPALSQGLRRWRMTTSWPKGLPGVGTGAARLARRIGELSDGRLTVEVYAADELFPALQVFDVVSQGTVEMGHDAAYYHTGKTKAAAFFTTVPFGMTAAEHHAWIYHGGGQELWERAYAPFRIQPFIGGNTGVQMGGWYRREIASVSDLSGLKIRMPGQGGEVMTRLGAVTVVLPGGQIYEALASGAIDAAEWIGPYNDESLGFFQVAGYYYFPGFHEPGAVLQATINQRAWAELPADLQAIVRAACAEAADNMLAEYNWRSPESLRTLVETHGVKLRQFPDEVLTALGNAAGEVMQSLLDGGDAITKEVATAYLRARGRALPWTRVGEQAFTRARLRPYTYP